MMLVPFLVLVRAVAAQSPPCNFTTTPPHTILSGYAAGYSPTKQPYPNTLEAAKAWCCKQGPKVCGGITHQAGTFDARKGCDPRHCSDPACNVSSWIMGRGAIPCAHPSPGPAPPPPGPHGPPPVDIPVWPIPSSVTLGPPGAAPVVVDAQFAITVPASAPRTLQDAATRYQAIIRKAAASQSEPAAGGVMAKATVVVAGMSTTLTFETDYSYTLTMVRGAAATVTAPTIFGAMYGLETLAQLSANGTITGSLAGATIKDKPTYRYRGLMLDTGRRFIPVPDVLNSLSAMSFTKMNVLHLHLSDDQRVAVDSTTFPNLTGHLKNDPTMGGSYSHADIKQIIQFANDRGIMVIPEIDLPGHANGLLPLKANGVTFCADSQMYADSSSSSSKTNEVLSQLISEYATLFGSQVFHLGCDETTVKAECTLAATKAVEVALSTHVNGANFNNNSNALSESFVIQFLRILW